MRDKTGRAGNAALVAFNVVCIVLIVALFVNYSGAYHEKLYSQNISGIEDLNKSSATMAEAVFSFRRGKLEDAAGYIFEKGMTLETALDYLRSMSGDGKGGFELVGKDFSGYLMAGKNSPEEISYKHSSYGALQRIFAAASAADAGAVMYAPEFTDARSAFKCFAFYTYVGIKNKSGAADDYYTLMYVSRSSDVMDAIQQKGGYGDLSVVLTDTAGNYIIGNPDFKSENFFKYIYVFNGLTLDQRNELAEKVLGSESGTLSYLNGSGEECVFVYSRSPDLAWYSISSVPYSSFDYQVYGNRLTVLVTALLSAMLVLDLLWFDRMNRRLKQSVQREKKANEAKTEFLSRMSHDIRTPLNAILGFTAITRDSPLLAPELRGNVNKIDTSGRYLLGIVNDVLDMAKIESGKVELHEEDTDCAALFSELAEIFSGEAQRSGIELKLDFGLAESRYLVLDPLRTKQIFSNLLSNAIKFSGSGTAVSWSVRESAAPDGRIALTSTVEDHGCGMSSEFLTHLFEPFSQERNDRSNAAAGTGLGLAIVKRLTELMGGTVKVESAVGRGASFTVDLTFRRGAGSGGVGRDGGETGDDGALKGKRVLVCEDNPLNREIAVTLLETKGVKAETAENGRVCVEMFSRSAPGYYNAVLMDIRMPVMNGLEAAAELRKLGRPDAGTVPIIAMTANAYDEDVRESLKAGMDAHIAKPFDPRLLYSTLERLTAGKA